MFILQINAFGVECPKAPEQIKKDWEIEVNAVVAKIGPVKGGELKARTNNATQDLLVKLPDAGRIYLEQMMFSAYCTALRDDKTITDAQKADLLKEYRAEVIKAIAKHRPDNEKGEINQPRQQNSKVKNKEEASGIGKISSSTTAEKGTSDAEIRVERKVDKSKERILAGKIVWDPYCHCWVKQVVLYNEATKPDASHPVWGYLRSLTLPKQKGRYDWELAPSTYQQFNIYQK
jgi:hypothetical protein